jgi:hypothetical protein
MATKKITLNELRTLVKQIIRKEKKNKILKESKIPVDIDVLIDIAKTMARMTRDPKWDDYYKSFVKVFGNMDLNDEQGERIFDWFTENFPSAPNDRLSQYIPALTHRASEWYGEGGFQNSKNWDDSPEDDMPDYDMGEDEDDDND